MKPSRLTVAAVNTLARVANHVLERMFPSPTTDALVAENQRLNREIWRLCGIADDLAAELAIADAIAAEYEPAADDDAIAAAMAAHPSNGATRTPIYDQVLCDEFRRELDARLEDVAADWESSC